VEWSGRVVEAVSQEMWCVVRIEVARSESLLLKQADGQVGKQLISEIANVKVGVTAIKLR
jgi:hypothetical protein